ncbi:hypothetical protein B0H15DRAFT_952232 [Mycena belliarum]|uniref:Uncharacterized protein n=1 Tax=Mycena belliarum TaxID=1033014 RepID=A0AAD6TZF8_9AGAR|nr:hypothetical protein B0H15DRAFT_952232 [Mycena belliae]
MLTNVDITIGSPPTTCDQTMPFHFKTTNFEDLTPRACSSLAWSRMFFAVSPGLKLLVLQARHASLAPGYVRDVSQPVPALTLHCGLPTYVTFEADNTTTRRDAGGSAEDYADDRCDAARAPDSRSDAAQCQRASTSAAAMSSTPPLTPSMLYAAADDQLYIPPQQDSSVRRDLAPQQGIAEDLLRPPGSLRVQRILRSVGQRLRRFFPK